jgi:hypothetical protein
MICRAALLWVVLPVAGVSWLVTLPIQLWRLRKGVPLVSLRTMLRWSDAVLTFGLERLVTVGRPARRVALGVHAPGWPPTNDAHARATWFTDAL